MATSKKKHQGGVTTFTTPSDREIVATRATGMTEGWSASYDRLEKYLSTMA